MRLIDADDVVEVLDEALKEKLDEETNYTNALKETILVGFAKQAINYAPTVDAVPVVRCKDCKHYIADGCDECELMIAKSIIASINDKRWYSDFYCAWGEKRTDETD